MPMEPSICIISFDGPKHQGDVSLERKSGWRKRQARAGEEER